MDPLEFLQVEYKNKTANAQEAKPETVTKKLNSNAPKDIPFCRQSQLIYWKTPPRLIAHRGGVIESSEQDIYAFQTIKHFLAENRANSHFQLVESEGSVFGSAGRALMPRANKMPTS